MNARQTAARRLAGAAPWLLAAALPLVGGGCGEPVVASASDPARALTTLAQALDAWKAGEPHEALQKKSPPIGVADEDWLARSKLLDYQIAGPEKCQTIGLALQVPVTLTLSDAKGKSLKRTVVYRITTDPTASVIRGD